MVTFDCQTDFVEEIQEKMSHFRNSPATIISLAMQKLLNVSQTAACDGNNYQIAPNEANGLYLPTGVLPL